MLLDLLYMMFKSWDGIGFFFLVLGFIGYHLWRLYQEAIYTVEIWLGYRK